MPFDSITKLFITGRQIETATNICWIIFFLGPENVVKLTNEYSQWLASSESLPKLYIHSEPGFFSPWIKEIIKNWPNQKEVSVKGLHFLQEDSPAEIGQAIKGFLTESVL